MIKLTTKNIELEIDTKRGVISSLLLSGVQRCVCPAPLFNIRLRDEGGECFLVDSTSAGTVTEDESTVTYTGFATPFSALTVKVRVAADVEIKWQIAIDNVPKEYALEWVEFPKVHLPRLIDNDPAGGKILFPYDEGIIVTDEGLLPRYEPEFPMSGAYFIFPNKLCSQFMAYLFDGVGLYIGAHDTQRSFKGVDFYKKDSALALQIRLYSGASYGEGYKNDYPIV